MKKALALIALLLFASAAHAELYVELDHDGDLGSLIDEAYADVGELVNFDVWIMGDAGGGGMFSFGVILCSFTGCIEFVSATYSVGSWSTVAPQPGPWPCVTLQATDFSGAAPIFFPAMIGTVTYRAVVNSCVSEIYLDVSGILGYDFSEYLYDNNGGTVAVVRIGTDRTEASSWGAVKGLFR